MTPRDLSSSVAKNSLVKVGVIASAHGLRGEVKLRSFANPPEAIFSYGALTDISGAKKFMLKKNGIAQELFIAAIDGVDDRNASELLKGTELYTESDKVPKTMRDLVLGLEVRSADGTVIGTVSATYNFGAGDIVEIVKQDGQSEMLPLDEKFMQIKKDRIVLHSVEYVEGSEK